MTGEPVQKYYTLFLSAPCPPCCSKCCGRISHPFWETAYVAPIQFQVFCELSFLLHNEPVDFLDVMALALQACTGQGP